LFRPLFLDLLRDDFAALALVIAGRLLKHRRKRRGRAS
jgi:hypothetical protein